MAKISPQEATLWMARLATADGVIMPAERKILTYFAETFDLDAGKIMRMAYGFATGVDIPEVELVGRNKMKISATTDTQKNLAKNCLSPLA